MNENMNDRMSVYYEAYYGTPIPLSQANRIEKTFTEMVKTIKADIENHLPYAEEPLVKAGILEALFYLQSTGDVRSPDLYLRNPTHANEAFRYAIAAASGKRLKREKTPQEVVKELDREKELTQTEIAESRERDEIRCNLSTPLYREYERVKAILIENGKSTKEAKIGSYISLLGNWEYKGGVDIYIVGLKLPTKEGIINEPEVLEALKNHHEFGKPSYGKRTGTKMMVNGKSWGGVQ